MYGLNRIISEEDQMKLKKHKSLINIKKIKKVEKIKDKYKQKITRFLEIPQELVGNSTRLSVVENKMIFLEGKNKIEDYYSHFIKIKTSNHTIMIDGKNMEIRGMEDSELVIEGDIITISFN